MLLLRFRKSATLWIMPTPTALDPNATIDEILHAMVILGITAASIWVKTPKSQAFAASIINATNQIVLPLADSLLVPKA